jgi:hypothetical protein
VLLPIDSLDILRAIAPDPFLNLAWLELRRLVMLREAKL